MHSATGVVAVVYATTLESVSALLRFIRAE